MERMDGEMVLHREEMVRLRGEIQTLEADAVELKTRLKDARRRQGAAARRMTTKRKMRRQRRPVLQGGVSRKSLQGGRRRFCEMPPLRCPRGPRREIS